jgi:adenylate kinase family enzyme
MLLPECVKNNKTIHEISDSVFIDQSAHQESDCATKGFVLDGFPLTKSQADLLSRNLDSDAVCLGTLKKQQ